MSLIFKGQTFSFNFESPVVFVEADGAVTGIMGSLWIEERERGESRHPDRIEWQVEKAMKEEIREAAGWGVRLEDYDFRPGEWSSLVHGGRLGDVYAQTAVRRKGPHPSP